mmetsp:Transcript_35509/g.89854  ORF Transcript_35509/g.89854 Transcript_35509/m.89854 type:complete len:392 (-) Transcript_35509:116-1291(-)
MPMAAPGRGARLRAATTTTCSVDDDARLKSVASSATICCTAGASGGPGTTASRTRTSPVSTPASCTQRSWMADSMAMSSASDAPPSASSRDTPLSHTANRTRRASRLLFSGNTKISFHMGRRLLYTVRVRYVRPSYSTCAYGSLVPAQSLAASSLPSMTCMTMVRGPGVLYAAAGSCAAWYAQGSTLRLSVSVGAGPDPGGRLVPEVVADAEDAVPGDGTSSGSVSRQGPMAGCHLSATGVSSGPSAHSSVQPSRAAATCSSTRPSMRPPPVRDASRTVSCTMASLPPSSSLSSSLSDTRPSGPTSRVADRRSSLESRLVAVTSTALRRRRRASASDIVPAAPCTPLVPVPLLLAVLAVPAGRDAAGGVRPSIDSMYMLRLVPTACCTRYS